MTSRDKYNGDIIGYLYNLPKSDSNNYQATDNVKTKIINVPKDVNRDPTMYIRWFDELYYIQNKSKIAILHQNEMLNYVTISTFDQSTIKEIFLRCIKKKEYEIFRSDVIEIKCILDGILENDTLEFSIPMLLFRDPDNTYYIDSFTILQESETIIIKDNKKYTKLVASLSELYKYLQSDVKYPIEIFKTIILSNIKGDTFIERTIKYTESNCVITYLWHGLLSGSFNLVIPIVNLKFDSDRILSDIINISESNIIVNHINNILSKHAEEKEKSELQTLVQEIAYFAHIIDNITPFNTVFYKLGKLYPHLSVTDCKILANKYTEQGHLYVHSGEYREISVNSGYAKINPTTRADWQILPDTFTTWSCCPYIYMKGYDRSKGDCWIRIHTVDNKIKFSDMNYTEYMYKDIVKQLKSSDKSSERFLTSYGLPDPCGFCINGKILKF